MSSNKINQMTQREWRELGFFYDRDDDTKEGRLQGSRAGLHKFPSALRDYAAHPGHAALSEHEHLGPYYYLEIGTWSSPEITDHWIAGPLPRLQEMADSVDTCLVAASAGDCICLRALFAPSSSHELVPQVQDDDFDPAAADAAC